MESLVPLALLVMLVAAVAPVVYAVRAKASTLSARTRAIDRLER